MRTPTQSLGNQLALPVAAATFIECGTIVCADGTTKLAKTGADTAGLVALGVAEFDADNTNGGAGDITVAVNRRVTTLANSAGDPVAQADLGNIVYVEDSSTVNKTGGVHKVIAGVLVGLSADASQVGVDFSATPALVALLAKQATAIAAAIAAFQTVADGRYAPHA